MTRTIALHDTAQTSSDNHTQPSLLRGKKEQQRDLDDVDVE